MKAFGANPGRRPVRRLHLQPAHDRGGRHSRRQPVVFAAATPPLPTKGRSLDHIGFEVEDLEAFVASLEAKGIKIEAPIRQVPNTKVKIAFLTDPWGTYIELTEGLAP